MTTETIEPISEDLAGELEDEALDRDRTVPSSCCGPTVTLKG